jgi:hypothetical protein
MKKILIVFLVLGSISTFAGDDLCGKIQKISAADNTVWITLESGDRAELAGSASASLAIAAQINNLRVCFSERLGKAGSTNNEFAYATIVK